MDLDGAGYSCDSRWTTGVLSIAWELIVPGAGGPPCQAAGGLRNVRSSMNGVETHS